MFAAKPLGFDDAGQARLWRLGISGIYERHRKVFGDHRLDRDLRNLLDNLDYLLNILSIKLPYQVKIARTREFMEDLDRFRVYSSRYLRRIAEQLYRDVREVIGGVFVSKVGEEDV